MSISNRYDFVLFFDVQDGNPNGDPDAGNMPRIDAETGEGLVTDVCIKRKIRNYVQLTKEGTSGYDIFIKEKAILNTLIEKAYNEAANELSEDEIKRGTATQDARAIMCQRYFDVRTFGAVMSTGKNAGQVRGPIQLTFARSVEPVVALEHSITRMAVATEKEAEDQSGDNRTMGRKYTVPYGLYCMHGFISAPIASQTGFSEEDLALFWQALKAMFEDDRSAARGLMSTRRVVVFKHSSKLGDASATELFERVSWRRASEGPARSFNDYDLLLDGSVLNNVMTTVSV